MNFQDLLSKLKSIDETMQPAVQAVSAPPSGPDFPDDGNAQLECGDDMPPKAPNISAQGDDEILIGEKDIDECGDMPSMSAPKQANNVTMNVSMNGSGAGGIKDLIDILRNIEGGHKDMVVGMDEVQDGGFGDATTEPDETTLGIDAVTATGRDLASKGAEAPKVNGGGNPMQESLVARLNNLYQEIKSR